MRNESGLSAEASQIRARHPLTLCYRWAIAAVGAIFFGYAFFRILFPSVTRGKQWDSNILYGFSAIAAMLVMLLVLWWLFRMIDRLAQRLLKRMVLILMLFAGALCILCTALFAIAPAWDYGVVLKSALDLSSRGILTDPTYFARYPFQIYPLLYLAFFMKLIRAQTMVAACGVSYVINIVHILFAVYGAFLFGKRCRDTRFGLKILLLCLFSLPLWLYASICYTDTLALPFPVWTLVLWLSARETPFDSRRQKVRKIALYLGSGLMAGLGLRIKSIAAIGLIALVIFILFDRVKRPDSEEKPAGFPGRPTIQKGIAIALLLAGFLAAAAGTGLLAKATGFEEMHDDRYTYPMTHWFMMGANRETLGGYYKEDDLFTRSIPTYAQREEQTRERYKERLRMDGAAGYLCFLMDKLEAMLCTGNYQAGGKLAQHPLVEYEALKSPGRPLAQIYLVYEQAFQSVILLSLLAGVFLLAWKPDGWVFRLTAMMVIGIVLFLLAWEGKARYLVFLIPIINAAAAAGFCSLQDGCRNLRTIRGRRKTSVEKA